MDNNGNGKNDNGPDDDQIESEMEAIARRMRMVTASNESKVLDRCIEELPDCVGTLRRMGLWDFERRGGVGRKHLRLLQYALALANGLTPEQARRVVGVKHRY